MIKKCFLSFLFAISLLSDSMAQEIMQLSLQECVDIAQQKSLKARGNYAYYESQFWRYKSAWASRFFSLNLNGSLPNLSRRINTITQPDGSILFIPQSNAFSNINLYLEQPIMPIGGSIYISTGLSRIDIFDQNLAYWQSTPLQIGVNLPLFDFNRRKWNWKQEKLNYALSGGQLAQSMEQLNMDVTQSYFDWYTAQFLYENAKSNAAINDSIYLISQGRYSLGKIAENELLQVELNVLNAKYDITSYEFSKDIAALRFKLLLGVDRKTEITFDTLPEAPQLNISPDQAISECLANNPTLLNFQLSQNNVIMQMKDAGRKRYISGNVSATFGLNQTGTTVANAYNGLLNSQTATVDFTIPIYNFGRAQADYRLAKKMLEANQFEMDYARSELEINIISQVMNLEQLRQSVELAKRAYDVSQERFEVTKNRFLIGKIDITNLTIAQGEKDQAVLNYVNTLRGYWLAYYELRKNTLYDFATGEKLIEVYNKKALDTNK